MRHIGFDESSVLKEFARIASDKGLIKEAQDIPQPRGEIANAPEPQSRPAPEIQRMDTSKMTTDDAAFARTLKKFPAIAAISAGQAPKGGLQALYNQMRAFFPAFKQEATRAGYKRLALPLVEKIGVYFKSNLDRRQVPQVMRELSMLQKADDMEMDATADAKPEQVKEAREDSSKLYDVTDETGEQLVEKAHPGGGTRTELTHSKTDENLVETIVEQQEKDVEVAKKAPKGTYATLVNLYNKLAKLGHESTELRDLIAKVASVDEVVGQTLITLADRLDAMGNAKAADAVDSLLKKKDLIS